jgi:hypothetical protein
MKSRLFIVAAMLGLLATACNKDEVTPQDDMTTKTPITINASYGSGNNGSKVSYTESGNTISATWQSGDKLLVVYNNNVNTLDLVDGAGENTATFSGDITGTPTEGAMLVCYVKDQNTPSGTITVNGDGSYIYTSDAFLGQDGTLAGASKLNLYCGWTRYSSSSDISCTFGVNTSMMKFNVSGISADAGESATIAYKSGNTEVAKATFTVAVGDNFIYLTIPAGKYSGRQTLVYTCEGTEKTHCLSETQANFTAGQTYFKAIDYFDPYFSPLTFEAKEANSTVKFKARNGSISLQYSTDGVNWNNYTSETIITLVNIGDRISFRGNNSTSFGSDLASYSSIFSCTGQCYIYGNIMSLVSSTNFSSLTTLPSNRMFSFLFHNNYYIYNHPDQELVLPATTLTESCYLAMFKGCFRLTTAPALSATTLKDFCYQAMFMGCSRLTTAPNLPATILKECCYSEMFSGCTSLNSTPALNAPTLVEGCYDLMFNGCTSLNNVVCLATNISAEDCTSSWLGNVSASGTFKKASSMSGWTRSASGIPSGWSVINL